MGLQRGLIGNLPWMLLALPAWAAPPAPAPMLIAPHIAGQSFCDSVVKEARINQEEEAALTCAARGENAADRISALLDSVGPALSPSGHFALGYTISFPLMRFYTHQANGWVLDQAAIATAVRTIHDVKRPVVLYFSANHFTDGGITLSNELATDTKNLMWTRHGPLPADKYFVVGLHAWTLVDPQAPITVMRRRAFQAVLAAVCQLDAASRARIQGVSVLGEVHQLYPNFLSGQGYNVGFDVTDYAPLSVAGFHQFLRSKFSDIDALNGMSGSNFASFDSVDPPSKDIQHEKLKSFFEHIDAYAAGEVPIQGWAFDPTGKPVHIAVFLDGRFRGEVIANLNRTDVPEADATVTTPNVGWRYNLDYRAEAPGVHNLEVFVAERGKRLVRIARRGLTVVPRDQSPAPKLPSLPVGADEADPKSPIRSYMDGPPPLTPLFYNPIAALWLDYRRFQVAEYMKSFARIVDSSCLGSTVTFSHQLMPELNSSWNSDLMAVDASQQPNPDYHQGTTLYGGAAWGDAFFDWKASAGWDEYAVSEMHPRFALNLRQFEDMLDAHRQHGAKFIAPYFMTIVPWKIRQAETGDLGKMTISPENHQLGSDTFYAAIADVMRNR